MTKQADYLTQFAFVVQKLKIGSDALRIPLVTRPSGQRLISAVVRTVKRMRVSLGDTSAH